jgi:hypothetical protein
MQVLNHRSRLEGARHRVEKELLYEKKSTAVKSIPVLPIDSIILSSVKLD